MGIGIYEDESDGEHEVGQHDGEGEEGGSTTDEFEEEEEGGEERALSDFDSYSQEENREGEGEEGEGAREGSVELGAGEEWGGVIEDGVEFQSGRGQKFGSGVLYDDEEEGSENEARVVPWNTGMGNGKGKERGFRIHVDEE